MKIVRFTIVAIGLASLSLTAHAVIVGPPGGGGGQGGPVRYSYVGNPFDTFDPGLPSGLTRISGFFEVPTPLGPNFSGNISPTVFEFSNGVDTMSNANIEPPTYNIVTDENGVPVAWFVANSSPGFNTRTHVSIRST